LPKEGEAKVAVISHKHPGDKSQREIGQFDLDTNITGNVDLSSPMVVEITKLEPWIKHNKSEKPMSATGVKKLKKGK